MPTTDTVNYHVQSAEPQAYETDAGGVAGRIVSPELVVPTIETRTDVRYA